MANVTVPLSAPLQSISVMDSETNIGVGSKISTVSVLLQLVLLSVKVQ